VRTGIQSSSACMRGAWSASVRATKRAPVYPTSLAAERLVHWYDPGQAEPRNQSCVTASRPAMLLPPHMGYLIFCHVYIWHLSKCNRNVTTYFPLWREVVNISATLSDVARHLRTPACQEHMKRPYCPCLALPIPLSCP
jgi:hypothetical protein